MPSSRQTLASFLPGVRHKRPHPVTDCQPRVLVPYRLTSTHLGELFLALRHGRLETGVTILFGLCRGCIPYLGASFCFWSRCFDLRALSPIVASISMAYAIGMSMAVATSKGKRVICVLTL